MQTVFARRAWIEDRWDHDLRITIQDGLIRSIATAQAPHPQDLCTDTLLPALSNLHSHSFQRAMAGMTEVRADRRDSFWTWRTLMYRFVRHITPEQYQAIAAQVFMEMQEAGYAAVGEFHYVHHQPGGVPYDMVSEMGDRVFAASLATGIGLTHLPVLYTYGGAGRASLDDDQQRFANTVDAFGALVEVARGRAGAMLPADARVGIAPHSLRATSPEDLQAVLGFGEDGPLHMHVAEQPGEVADIQAWLGARPVEWLLQNAPVDERWCLIHATHMSESETTGLARSGAVAGLCPITEANLGDGPFNGPGYLAAGGAFGIGSDSNVRISLTEELRMLEYSQRLRDQSRNVMVAEMGSVGQSLYLGAARGGARALGRDGGRIAVGALADLVAIDSCTPTLCALREDQLFDGLCFAASDTVVTDLWSAGRHSVRNGRHMDRDRIVDGFRAAIADLLQATA